MTAGRDTTAQRPPDTDPALSGFPTTSLSRGARFCREHGSKGPWYFASGPGGRFNLDDPDGTLYLAVNPEDAARKRIGGDFDRSGRVPASVVTGRSVSILPLPQPVVAADLVADKAEQYGIVLGELTTMTPYAVPRAWAAAFAATGFGGLWTTLRFSVPLGRGLAVFGVQGPRDWPADDQPRALRRVVESMSITVDDPPHETGVTILSGSDL